MYYDSPFYNFIKTNNEQSIFEELDKGGIKNIQNINFSDSKDHQFEFFIAKNYDSLVILDNWFYSLFHINCHYPIIDNLGISNDMFQFVVGDSDHSFGFKKFVDGKIIRNYQVSNLSYRKGDLKIETNIGIPLPGESKFLSYDDEYDKTVNIAFEEGMILPSDITQIKRYTYRVEKK